MADDNQKQLVALGYDRIADSYLERFGRSSVRAAKLAEVIGQLPAGASILDLGCGAGIPVAHELVTLVSTSLASMLQVGKLREPGAMFPELDSCRPTWLRCSRLKVLTRFWPSTRSRTCRNRNTEFLSAASRNGFDPAADSLPILVRQRETGLKNGWGRLCFSAIIILK